MLLAPPLTRIPVARALLRATVVTPASVAVLVGVVNVPPPEAIASTVSDPLLVIEPVTGLPLIVVTAAVPVPTVVVVGAFWSTIPWAYACALPGATAVALTFIAPELTMVAVSVPPPVAAPE